MTPSNLFSVISTIDGLIQLQIYEVMRLTHAYSNKKGFINAVFFIQVNSIHDLQ